MLESLYLLLLSLEEAETGQQRYILAGKQEYLQPYYHSATRIVGQLGQLRSLTAGDPAQQERVNLVLGMATRRVGVLNEGISLRLARGLNSAKALALTGQGKALMDSAWSTVSDLQAVERNLLRERSAKSEILAVRTELTIMLACSLGLLLLATSALLANWEIRARRAAEAGLRQANEELEDRVAERTEKLECLNEGLRVENEERARVEAQLRSQKDFLRKVVDITGQFRKLKELEAARDTLTHMIVHDLRSPLTGLQGYLDLLRMAVAAGSHDEVLEFARDAHAVAGHLEEMISQVLDVSRLESGDMPLSPEDTDLVQLLPGAVASLGPPPEGMEIVYELADRPVVIACDRKVVARVVANLVGNAFKFVPRRGEVRIGLEGTNGVVRVTVTDNGPGVQPEHRKLIFEKFGQAPLGRAGKARSSGLGLTFCKLAVEAHGGKIGVDSSNGGGARFWIELPRKTGPV